MGLRTFIKDCFAKHLAPHGVSLVIAGQAGPAAVAGVNVANLACLGRVENLAPLYAASRVVIAPLLEGTGGSIKVQEAIAAGKPVLGSKIAWRGMNVATGVALAPPFDQTWAQAIQTLLRDRNAREALFLAGANALLSESSEEITTLVARVSKK